jgi:putative metal-binding protein
LRPWRHRGRKPADECHRSSIGVCGLALTADQQPDRYADSHDDCDDTDSSVYPGAVERAGNGTDEDCDGRIDEWDDLTPAP